MLYWVVIYAAILYQFCDLLIYSFSCVLYIIFKNYISFIYSSNLFLVYYLVVGLLHFTYDPYLIMLSVKQEGIKYYFLSLWHDSNWDWTLVFQAIGKHSTH